MRKFKVIVNGETFEVEVEEVDGHCGTNPAALAAPSARPVAPPATTPKSAPPERSLAAHPVSVAGKGELVTAPLPGVILDVKVTVGQRIKAGEVLVILEAMKMANEIVAPLDGTVAAVHATRGASVTLGAPLVTIE